MLRAVLTVLALQLVAGLVVPLKAARPAESFSGISLKRAAGGAAVDLGDAIRASTDAERTMIVRS